MYSVLESIGRAVHSWNAMANRNNNAATDNDDSNLQRLTQVESTALLNTKRPSMEMRLKNLS